MRPINLSKPVIYDINDRDSIISFDELHEKLITWKLTARNIHFGSPTPFSATVLAAQHYPIDKFK